MLNSLSCNSSTVDSFEFFKQIISHVNSFIFYFFILVLINSISHLIALVRISSTMHNRSADSRHPCLVPILREKSFHFSPLSIIFANGFCIYLIRIGKFLSTIIWNISNASSMISIISLYSIILINYIEFWNCSLEIKPTWFHFVFLI